MSVADEVAAAIHDLRSSVGSIRLAVSSVIEDDEDADFRREMLSGAADETRRLNTGLSAVSALVVALTDDAPREPLDLSEALQRAAEQARQQHVDVDVRARDAARVRSRVASLDAVLAALCLVVADVGGAVIASVAGDNRVEVRIERADGRPVRSDRALVRSLVAAIGADTVSAQDGIAFAFPIAPS